MIKCEPEDQHMKKLWLVVNAFLRGSSFAGMQEALVQAAEEAGIDMKIKTNADFIARDSLINPPATALFFDKDIRLAKRMELSGMRLFNSAHAIAVCDDKTLTSLVLEQAGLPQPETILCPTSYPGIGFGEGEFLDEVIHVLGLPLVVKEGKGSFGQQVYLAHSKDEILAIFERAGHCELLFQRFISESAGSDLRLYVVGKQIVAAIRRVNTQGDFRANLENGASAFPHTPTAAQEALALAASAACGTDFAGVDLLQSNDGPLVCEVNSNAHFLGLMRVTGINPAKAIMKQIKATL
jgi:RimK family alpha-L-glutamate ligase